MYKKIIGLTAAMVCFVVLLGVLFWSIVKSGSSNDSSKDETAQVEGDSSSDETTPTAPEKEESSEKEEPKQEEPKQEEKEPEEEKEEEKQPEKEKPAQNTQDKKPETNSETNVTVSTGKLNPNPKTKEEIEAVLNDPFMLLVNRGHKVSSSYVPSDLVTFSGDYKLNSTCAAALRKLINAGKNAGYNYVLYSGYRTYSSQYNKYYNKIAYWEGQGRSKEEAIRLTDQYYAPPGASEHHTGLAADVCIPSIVNKYACLHEAYDQTPEFKWFSSHAHEYGFILRYREGDEDITGYSYEPWHYRYVGVEIATEIYNRDITFEEYVEDLEARLEALK